MHDRDQPRMPVIQLIACTFCSVAVNQGTFTRSHIYAAMHACMMAGQRSL